VNFLSYIDICSNFVEKYDFGVVKQLLVIGPTCRYYLLKDDSSIRTLQYALSSPFSVLQSFVIDEGEATILTPNICDLNKPYPVVPVELGTD